MILKLYLIGAVIAFIANIIVAIKQNKRLDLNDLLLSVFFGMVSFIGFFIILRLLWDDYNIGKIVIWRKK